MDVPPLTRTDQLQCDICKVSSSNNICYRTFKTLCNNCRSKDDITMQSKEGGDVTTDEKQVDKTGKTPRKSRHKISDVPNHNLACGDYDNSSVKIYLEAEETSCEITVEYKNVNFKISKSTMGSESSSNYTEKDSDENAQIQRPVTCPVTECKKVIALDSILLHFYFDHSKIHRLHLKSGSSSEIYIKITDLVEKTRCLARFLPSTERRSVDKNLQKVTSYEILNKEFKCNSPVFLMGARFRCCSTTLANKSGFKNVSTRTGRDTMKRSTQSLMSSTKYQFKTESVEITKSLSNHEVLLFWFCKVNDNVNQYSITLTREDRRLGHSYIGEATHIRENHDAKSILDRAECLIVKGNAVNNVLDSEGKLLIFVNVIF